MYQDIWSSGTRMGGGSLRWCSTDKPFNVSSVPLGQPLESYSEDQVYMKLFYAGNNFYTGNLVQGSIAGIALCG